MTLPDVHPDGDPFAARDAERDANSWLGQLEQRARLQDSHATAEDAAAHPTSSELISSPVPPTRPRTNGGTADTATRTASPAVARAPRVSQSLGVVDARGREILIVDTDDDDEPENMDDAAPTTAAPSEAADPTPKLEQVDDDEADNMVNENEDADEPMAPPPQGEEGDDAASGTEADEGDNASEEGDDDEEDGEDGEGEGEGEGEEDEEEEETEEESDEDDDDDDDDDTNSMTSERPRVKKTGGEGEAPDGAPKSPKKVSADGDVEMKEGGAEEGAAAGEAGGEGSGENGEAAAPKEKKKRRRRQPRTPTPPPLAPKERRATVRLAITLPPRKNDTAPDFNIVELSKKAGFVKEVEEANPNGREDDDDEDASESDGQGGRRKKEKGKAVAGDGAEDGTPGAVGEGEPPKKRRKRGPNVILGRFGGYDTTDPFVDDDEAEFYEPQYTARPKREGYFICAGEVEVAARRGRVKGSKNKPKTDASGQPLPQASRKRGGKVVLGPDGKPIADTPDGGSSGVPSPALNGGPTFGAPAGPPPPKQRKKGEFAPELQEKLDYLKVESDKEPWVVKSKFPPHLKEELVKVAYFALEIGEYDDEFYAVMPKIFPYNLFTMKKLIKREVYPKRMRDLAEDLEQQYDILKEGIRRTYGPQREDFERRMAEYEQKLAQGDGTTASGSVVAAMRKTPEPAAGPLFGNSPAISTPLIATVDGMNGSPAPGKDDADDKSGVVEEPKWRFRFDETMRMALWRASEIEDKMSELTIEKQELEKATTREHNREKPYSSKAARKVLYDRILELWPTGSMTTNQISREISNYKLKLKKHGDLPTVT
ncbi:hypothetical protein JCM10908_005474 [Rhodotorula pacifica]|uniref:uncharacterized protein n=1 Tax=Rhodotorula pacifica TaxID=1495444 RepID=UPI003179D2E4